MIDGSVIQVFGLHGTSFLLFIYAVPDMPGVRCYRYYAVDFGVKKQEGVCHLSHFDAISEAYQAILGVLEQKNSIRNGAIDAT